MAISDILILQGMLRTDRGDGAAEIDRTDEARSGARPRKRFRSRSGEADTTVTDSPKPWVSRLLAVFRNRAMQGNALRWKNSTTVSWAHTWYPEKKQFMRASARYAV